MMKSLLLILATLLFSSCFLSDDKEDQLDSNRLVEPVDQLGFETMPSLMAEPMVWGSYYYIDESDSIVDGDADRTQLDQCSEDEEITYHFNYTPLYSSKEEFKATIDFIQDDKIINPGKIYRLGDAQFISDVNRGIHVYDYTDPNNPIKLGFLSLPGNIDIAIMDGILYANSFSTLIAIDVRDLAKPIVKKILYEAFEPVYKMGYPMIENDGGLATAWQRDTVYTCYQNYYRYDDCIDCEILPRTYDAVSTDLLEQSGPGQGGSMARFELDENHLYAIDLNKLYTFNIQVREDPKKWSRDEVGFGVETIFRQDSALYLGTQRGLIIYDISKPSNPVKASELSHTVSCDPVVVQDGLAYVTLRSGTACWGGDNELQIVDVQDIYAPSLIETHAMHNPHGLAIQGDLLYICEGDAGLKVFKLEEGLSPVLQSHLDGFHAKDIIIDATTAYITGEGGMRVYDISDPTNLQLLSEQKQTLD